MIASFTGRRFEVALQHYQSYGSPDALRLPADLLYRVALCQEGLGLWSKSLENLQAVSSTTDNPLLKAAADFGQARIRLRLNEPRHAISLLRSIEFYATETRPLPKSHVARYCLPSSAGHGP